MKHLYQILILVEFHSNTCDYILSTIFSRDVGAISSRGFTISLRDSEINQYKCEHSSRWQRPLLSWITIISTSYLFLTHAVYLIFLLSVLHLWCLKVTLSILLTLDFHCHWTLRVRPLLPGKRITNSLPVNKWQYIWYT